MRLYPDGEGGRQVEGVEERLGAAGAADLLAGDVVDEDLQREKSFKVSFRLSSV